MIELSFAWFHWDLTKLWHILCQALICIFQVQISHIAVCTRLLNIFSSRQAIIKISTWLESWENVEHDWAFFCLIPWRSDQVMAHPVPGTYMYISSANLTHCFLNKMLNIFSSREAAMKINTWLESWESVECDWPFFCLIPWRSDQVMAHPVQGTHMLISHIAVCTRCWISLAAVRLLWRLAHGWKAGRV